MFNKFSNQCELIICVFSLIIVLYMTIFGFSANILSVEASTVSRAHSIVKMCKEFVHHRVR